MFTVHLFKYYKIQIFQNKILKIITNLQIKKIQDHKSHCSNYKKKNTTF